MEHCYYIDSVGETVKCVENEITFNEYVQTMVDCYSSKPLGMFKLLTKIRTFFLTPVCGYRYTAIQNDALLKLSAIAGKELGFKAYI